MTRLPSKVAGFLFCSGLTALIYQTIWSRQFRLIFGSSTYATSAVLAIFMGGLGVGSLVLGKRADGKSKKEVMWRAIRSAALVAEGDRAQAQRMAALLDQPFAARLNDQQRAIERIHAGYFAGGCSLATIEALRAVEPYVPWEQGLLLLRRDCYGQARLAGLAAAARSDMKRFAEAETSAPSQ